MPRWMKAMVAVLLIPLCLGASQALFWVLLESGRGAGGGKASAWEEASRTLVPLLGGGACWVVIYLLLPRPMWVYVFGHELTHVIWAWMFEAKVKRFRVSARGGHVVLDKVNFLIVLAPYFFPLYALCVALIYGLGALAWDSEVYRVGFLLLLGAAYGFHVTLTGHALQTEQTDITSQGWLFSIVVIWLGNLLVLIPGLCVLLRVSLKGAFLEWAHGTWAIARVLLPGV